MKINVEFMAFVRRPENVPRTFERDINEPTTIKQLLINLHFTSDEIMMMQCFISSADTDNVRAQRSYYLKDGDNLFVTLPIGGG